MAQLKTVTLDDDVAEKVDRAAQKSGKESQAVVNETLRNLLEAGEPFVIEARDMGLRPGFNLECTAELLEQLEGRITGDSGRCESVALRVQQHESGSRGP